VTLLSRDSFKLHQVPYNANSVISHNVSDYFTDCQYAFFFQQDTFVSLFELFLNKNYLSIQWFKKFNS